MTAVMQLTLEGIRREFMDVGLRSPIDSSDPVPAHCGQSKPSLWPFATFETSTEPPRICLVIWYGLPVRETRGARDLSSYQIIFFDVILVCYIYGGCGRCN